MTIFTYSDQAHLAQPWDAHAQVVPSDQGAMFYASVASFDAPRLVAYGDYRVYPDKIEIEGAQFIVEVVGASVSLLHPHWSLSGDGKDLVEARQRLMDEARELAEIMVLDDPAKLSKHAARMREFVLRVK